MSSLVAHRFGFRLQRLVLTVGFRYGNYPEGET